MKKNIIVILLVALLVSVYSLSIVKAAKTDIKAGTTLKDLRNSLKELQKKEADNKAKKQKTKEEINASIKKKNKTEEELEDTKEELNNLSIQVENTNKQVEDLKKETEELLVAKQKQSNQNLYANYITGASSITELIMRIDAITQITEASQGKLDNLELLINNSKKMDKKIGEYQKTLNKKIVEYEQLREDLEDELAEMELGAVSIGQEITAMKQLIKSYEMMGCKEDQDLLACASAANNTGWLRPIAKGKITSLYGKRVSPISGASSYHRGVDIGVPEKSKVYATAAGTVGAIIRKSSCGGNMVYVWTYVNNKPYTYVFMHLYSISVEVGQVVDVSTVIGLSGGGSTGIRQGGYDRCTTGAHIHYGVASGGFYGSNNSNLALSKFNANSFAPPGYPGLYQWFYTR
jgi:murein DD-endopeptidase MepM/ murein hydrolase activator NlpD